jgi:CDP-diglyceride synthetase
MKLFIVALVVFLMNVPFGYWRANVRKFSLQWALAIHIPVPFVILLRIYGDLGFSWETYPVMVGAFFGGQFAGKKLFVYWREHLKTELSSCLVMDVFYLVKHKN